MNRALTFPSFRTGRVLLLAVTLLWTADRAPAVVDDAHSAAIALAAEPVKQGFKLRQEYWKGTLKSGGQKLVKHQLFKGNEVWFWLGTAAEKATLVMEIFDAKGQRVAVTEVKKGSGAIGVRLSPPRTGTYQIAFKLTNAAGEEMDWALVYGWK